jgi:hypothetical protein
MAYIAKTFIGDAGEYDNTETDLRGNTSLAKKVEDWLTASSAVTGKVTIGSCDLKGDRVHVLVVAETA